MTPGAGFEVMGPAGGNGLGQYLRYVDFCVANSTGSTMDGSSFSGLLTRAVFSEGDAARPITASQPPGRAD